MGAIDKQRKYNCYSREIVLMSMWRGIKGWIALRKQQPPNTPQPRQHSHEMAPMESKPLLVVLAATGSQGTAVLTHFLSHEPGHRLRGTTRNASSPKAQALAAQGVEIFQADLNDPASLAKAFEGASFIFAYTDSAGNAQSHLALEAFQSGKEKSLPDAAGALEVRQGRNIADAAAQIPSLQKVVWSSTPDPRVLAEGKFDNYEMAAKADVQGYMRAHPGLKGKVHAVYLSVFTASFVRAPVVVGWTRNPLKGNAYTVNIPWNPKALIPWIDLDGDAGSWVAALFKTEGEVTVAASGGEMSTEEVVGIISKKLGVEIEIEEVSLQTYASVEPLGLMHNVGQLMRFVADLGIGRGVEGVVQAEEVSLSNSFCSASRVREQKADE